VSAIFKHIVMKLKFQHEGKARELTFHPRDNIFEYSTNWCALFVLLHDQQLKFNIFEIQKLFFFKKAVLVEDLSDDAEVGHITV